MTDLLADLSGELELVAEHLTTTRGDISGTRVQLEVAAAGTRADADAAQVQRQAALDSTAAAAMAAAGSAEEAVGSLMSQLEMKDAELGLLNELNEQLSTQVSLLKRDAEAAAAAAATSSSSAQAAAAAAAVGDGAAAHSARLRRVLALQAECNMRVLDNLGILAQTVVGLPGLDPAERVKLASSISAAVSAVGAVGVPDGVLNAGGRGGGDSA
jgi:hypothetical protein